MSYRARDLVLASMGFASYKDYLASDLWKSIRSRVFAGRAKVCKLCGKCAEVIHHIKYKRGTLKGTSIGDLVLLCRACHELVEFSDGQKLTMKDAQRKYAELRKQRAVVDHEHNDDAPADDVKPPTPRKNKYGRKYRHKRMKKKRRRTERVCTVCSNTIGSDEKHCKVCRQKRNDRRRGERQLLALVG